MKTMREKVKVLKLLPVGLLAAALMGGCSGDTGPPGPPGPPGTEAPVTPTTAVDTCVVCHGDVAVFSAREQHDAFVSRAATWDVLDVEVDESDVLIHVFIDPFQANGNQFTNIVGDLRYMRVEDGEVRSANYAGDAEVIADEDEAGVYTIVIDAAGLEGWSPEQEVTWRVRLNAGTTYPEASVVAYQNARVMTSVSNQACINCHGPNIFVNAMGQYESVATDGDGNRREMTPGRVYHFSAYGVESCIMCHSAGNHVIGDYNRMLYYAHSIHSSNNVNQINAEQGGLEVKEGWNWSVRYPGDMHNCSACHMGEEDLSHVLEHPFTLDVCASCHGTTVARTTVNAIDWDSFTWNPALGVEGLHRGLSPLIDCSACHVEGGIARSTVGDYHVGFNPELRAAENLNMEITAVESAGFGAPIRIHWEAFDDEGALYDACNTDPAAGPTFLGEFAVRIAYFQGDDIANVGVGTFGQPGATTPINATTTTCDEGRATTTVNLHEGAVAERAMISFDGRPRLDIEGFPNQQARVPVPSFAFMIADGAESSRRQIVDTNKCIQCHLGNMYRHGGGRNDNIEACIACHNPSATDQGVRAALGIDASNSYDRKIAESFSMAYNMHAVHGVGERDAFYVVYRNRGIYGYGGPTTAPRNWPVDIEGNPAANAPGAEVFGSDPPANITHYLKRVNFPNRLNNCLACHFEGTYGIPDQSQALAISVDSGADGADQTDDRLMSPATGACMSCHQSGSSAVQAALRGHAAMFSWEPQVIEGGKEAVLEAAQ